MKKSGFWFAGEHYPFAPMAGGEGDGNDTPPVNDSGNGDSSDNGQGAGNQGADNKAADTSQAALNSVNAQLRQANKKIADFERAQREATEREAAAKGEFETLYTKLKADSEATIADLTGKLFQRDARDTLLDYLTEKHAGHIKQLRWVWPVLAASLTSDMDANAVKAEAKRVADEYVKDHPLNVDESGAPKNGNQGSGKPPADPLANFAGLKSRLDSTTVPVSGMGAR